MDGVADLLDEARANGLTLQVEGEKLVVRGPLTLNRWSSNCWRGSPKSSRR